MRELGIAPVGNPLLTLDIVRLKILIVQSTRGYTETMLHLKRLDFAVEMMYLQGKNEAWKNAGELLQ